MKKKLIDRDWSTKKPSYVSWSPATFFQERSVFIGQYWGQKFLSVRTLTFRAEGNIYF